MSEEMQIVFPKFLLGRIEAYTVLGREHPFDVGL